MNSPTENEASSGPTNDCLLLLTLEGLVDPKVTRLISVSRDLVFLDLHYAIHKAFQWQTKKKYCWSFSVLKSPETRQKQFEGSTISVQSATSSHPVGTNGAPDDSGGPPEYLVPDISILTPLLFMLDLARQEGKRLLYEYAEQWAIQIRYVGDTLTESHGKLSCLSGEGHPPAETIGGPSVWRTIVREYETANSARDKHAACKPFGKATKNPDPEARSAAGPWNWDMGKVNSLLKRLSTANAKKRKRSRSTESEASSYYSMESTSSQFLDRDPPNGNYILRISLEAFRFPAVNRIISCPTDLNFKRLHQAIQLAFDWRFYHAWYAQV